MPKEEIRTTLIMIGKGLLAAVSVTLAAMVLLAALIMVVAISDGALLIVNQLVKLTAVFLGAKTAVGIGGRRGFALGASVGLLYMVFGYALYSLLDGALAGAQLMAAEFAIGAGAGGLSGAICANMKPRKRSAGKTRARAA